MNRRIYYIVKPIIPRKIQLAVRRWSVSRKLPKVASVWPINEQAGGTPGGWKGWPDGKKFALVLTHDVDTQLGHDRCEDLAALETDMGFRSSFNFVPERYSVSKQLRNILTSSGFEVGVHGLLHDGKYFDNRTIFRDRAKRINEYIREWGAAGYRSPSMLHNLDWIHDLEIKYDASTFDSDPFEPDPYGVGTIFPFRVRNNIIENSYVELPYTLSQDFTLYILMGCRNIDIWKRKLRWIAEKGGMALLNTHPDYMNFHGGGKNGNEEYPSKYYADFLQHIRSEYKGDYWSVLPKELALKVENGDISTDTVISSTDVLKKKQLYKKIINIRGIEKNKLKICMLVYAFYNSDNRVRRYAEELIREGHEVDVISLFEENDNKLNEFLNGVHVFKIQKRIKNEKNKYSYLYRIGRFFFHSLWVVSRFHMKKQYDVIHVHNVPDFLIFSAILPKIQGAKTILDIHDILPEFYVSKFNRSTDSMIFRILVYIERFSARFADHVIVSNHIWQERLLERSVPKGKMNVIMNYPDSNIFFQREKKSNKDKIIFVYPGTLNYHQGVDIAIQAFYLASHTLPTAEFHIYGDGPERAKLEGMVSDLGMKKIILFKGRIPIDQLADEVANADFGIVPKRDGLFGGDAFSTKILEFMIMGIPAIVSRTRIDRFYFNDDVVRFFPPEDAESLSNAIIDLVKRPEERERLVNNATEFVSVMTWDVKKQDYLKILDQLVAY